MDSKFIGIVACVTLIATFSLATSLVWADDVVLFEEDFEDVALEDSIMEQVKGQLPNPKGLGL